MVNEERMRKTFTDLVKIYAPSKGEREVCDYLKKELKKLGASRIVEDNDGSINGGNSGNLIATFNGNAEGLPSPLPSPATWTAWSAAETLNRS